MQYDKIKSKTSTPEWDKTHIRKGAQEKAQETVIDAEACSHTQEAPKNTKPEAVKYM